MQVDEPPTGIAFRSRQDRPQWLIVIAASAGGIQAVRTVLAALPPYLPATIVVVQHRTPGHDRYLGQVLGSVTKWPVHVAAQGERLEAGRAYLARSDSHLTVTPDLVFLYHNGTRIRFVRSSANPLFASAARVFGAHVIGVVLSGSGCDATDGVQGIKANGGIVIVQDEPTSQVWGMPRAAIETGVVDYVLPVEAIASVLASLITGEPVDASNGRIGLTAT
jgi:two-component system, chemotaxis family, protein-glutamate methylesterase/glutaminase